jgi:hypothetical protein
MATTTFILGIIWGFVMYHISLSIKEKNRNKKIIKEINSKFKEVLINIKNKKTVFVSRVNHTVMFDTRIQNLDVVNIVYLMDKQIVCIFKDNNCIYTSDSLDNNIKSDLLIEINKEFSVQINDVVNIMGMTISKEEFNKRMQDIQDVLKQNPNSINIDLDLQKDTINEIVEENDKKFDVDTILDKISRHGINSITKEEKEFLDNLNK